MYGKRQSAFALRSHGKVECRACKTLNLPGALFSFSMFTRAMISVSVIYYIYIILFNLKKIIIGICSDCVFMKDFCNYL